ncbi:hypothetical protein V8C35DRAFT_319174 [Trichoderma chlorosporum]
MMEPENHGALRFYGVDELRAALKSSERAQNYPLMVKPCLGRGSECVSKVTNDEELVAAVQKASARHLATPQGRVDVVVEPYIDGPEVDANFVLLNREIIFDEIIDDFPKHGDIDNNQANNFLETSVMIPTALPEREKRLIRTSIHQSILRQGFLTGVFHCEARLQHSSMEYGVNNGPLCLQHRLDNENTSSARVFLLEINARPPGYLESVAVRFAYGVDYYALQMLRAVDDLQRFEALAKPFASGPQYFLMITIIQDSVTGIMKTADAGKELLARRPDLVSAVVHYQTVKKGVTN